MDILWPEEDIPTLQEQKPQKSAWRFPVLYGLNKRGDDMVWQIGYDGKRTIYTCFGRKDSSKLRTVTREISRNNSGRKFYEQAFLEALNRFDDKYIKDGYRPYGDEPVQHTEPMLAISYCDANIEGFPILVQPKLDGMRLLISLEDNRVKIRTRRSRIYEFPHLEEELLDILNQLPDGAVLDGEFYKHGWNFNRISSAAKTINGNKDTHRMKYHVYDIMVDGPYEERYAILENIFTDNEYPHVVLVETNQVESEEEIEVALDYYLDLKYEGIMLRKISAGAELENTLYEMGRCTKKGANLIKYKLFNDTEATIVGVESAKGVEKGCAIFILQWGDKRISVRPTGTHEERRQWLKKPKKFIGKEATIRYNELTADGVPRFPRLHSIRDYE